jgi:hypothetical protein
MIIKSIIIFLAVFLIIYGYKRDKNNIFKILFRLYIVVLFLFSTYSVYSIIRENFNKPKEFDFLCFYLNGNVAANNLNFYEPKNYKTTIEKLSIPFKPSKAFTEEIVNVGFWYPPPTMFLFLPLGYLNFIEAHKLWILINILFLITDLLLLWKIFFKNFGLEGFLISSSLFMLMGSTRTSVGVEQTSFIYLFFLLLIWKDHNNYKSGIWLAIGIFIKPVLIFLYIYFLFNRNWKQIFMSILTCILIVLITISFFNLEIFISYFIKNPTSHLPIDIYTEWSNQSLFASVLRLTGNFNNSIYIVIPIYIFIISSISFISFKIINKKPSIIFILVLISGLLLYPASLNHYSIILIIPILFLLKESPDLSINDLSISLIICTIYLFVQLNYIFIANIFTLIILALIGILGEKKMFNILR